MAEQTEFTVRITADETVDVHEYLWDVLGQLDSLEGIHSIMVDRNDQEERDISEIVRILNDLSDHEMNRLEDAIDSYTEGTDEH